MFTDEHVTYGTRPRRPAGDVVDTSWITFLASYVQQHGSYDKWSTLCSHFGAPPGVHGPRSGGRTCQPLGAGDVPPHNAAQIT